MFRTRCQPSAERRIRKRVGTRSSGIAVAPTGFWIEQVSTILEGNMTKYVNTLAAAQIREGTKQVTSVTGPRLES